MLIRLKTCTGAAGGRVTLRISASFAASTVWREWYSAGTFAANQVEPESHYIDFLETKTT